MVDDDDDHKFEEAGPARQPIPAPKPPRTRKPKPLTLPHAGIENEFGFVDYSNLTPKQRKKNEKAERAWMKDPYEYDREKDPDLSRVKASIVYLVRADRYNRIWEPVSDWLTFNEALRLAQRKASQRQELRYSHVGVVDWKHDIDVKNKPDIASLDNENLEVLRPGNNRGRMHSQGQLFTIKNWK